MSHFYLFSFFFFFLVGDNNHPIYKKSGPFNYYLLKYFFLTDKKTFFGWKMYSKIDDPCKKKNK